MRRNRGSGSITLSESLTKKQSARHAQFVIGQKNEFLTLLRWLVI